MSTLVETTVLYITVFTEMLQEIAVTTINYGLNAVGVSPDTISELTNCITKPTDQLGLNFVELYKQSIDSLYFDQFQILLIKIFLLTLFSILIMIYAAWYVYGTLITDKFMYSGKVMKNEHNDIDEG